MEPGNIEHGPIRSKDNILRPEMHASKHCESWKSTHLFHLLQLRPKKSSGSYFIWFRKAMVSLSQSVFLQDRSIISDRLLAR
ncbi:hypothetical protein V6N13_103096 [Hibiscus sabdariffa]|uniref:Uncharacterized protein n=1 Tax=Hibiscus sabdariffa TaxID=183260 RepID=A0ABR2C5R2_9ROSI